MAGPGNVIGRNERVFIMAGVAAIVDPDMYANIVGAGKIIVPVGVTNVPMITNQLRFVESRGSMGRDANIVSATPMGEESQIQGADVPELPNFEVSVFLKPTEALHNSLLNAAIGDTYSIAVYWWDTGGAQYAYAFGEIAGANEDNASGAFRTCAFTFALRANWQYVLKP